jgi:large subunit ribosomal protein L18
MSTKLEKANKRIKRVRAKVFGRPERPRLAVFRSNRYVSAQIIDDSKGKTLVFSTSKNLKSEKGKSKTDLAYQVGEELAKSAKKKRIGSVIFDKRSYKYHGVIKALADGARKGGLTF